MQLSADCRLVTVFEAANDTTKELYIGVTALLIDSLIRAHQKNPPHEIAHWRREHLISYRCVEYAMPRSGASEFIKKYANSNEMQGWKVVRSKV